MDSNIRELQRRFSKIKNMGYVKSVRSGSTGIGATFEFLLGKEEDDLEIPDFVGIEIKTKRSYSKSYISLFNAVPTGSGYYEVKRLRDYYGYPINGNKDLKQLYAEVFSNRLTRVGLWYYFGLKVDFEREKIFLLIYNHRDELVDDSTYWDFDILKEKLERKLSILALIKAWPNMINGIEHFKYYKMNIYILREFDSFVKAISEGKIRVTFRISSYDDEKKYGMVDSHGVSFAIREDDLLDIFEIYR